VSDLAAALRETGHGDVAAALERKELAGRFRQSGRDDLADALEAGEPTPPVEETAGKAKVELASADITAGYAAEDQRAVTTARKAEQEAVAQVRELQHRVDGATLRVERAQQQLDEFAHQHADDLLAEREPNARTVAAELSASVRETLRLAKAYAAERQVARICAAGGGRAGRGRRRRDGLTRQTATHASGPASKAKPRVGELGISAWPESRSGTPGKRSAPEKRGASAVYQGAGSYPARRCHATPRRGRDQRFPRLRAYRLTGVVVETIWRGYSFGRARREDWSACNPAMPSLPPPPSATRPSGVKRAGNDRVVAEASLGAGHPLVGVLGRVEGVFEQMVLVTGVQAAGVLMFSGRLRLSLVIAAAVVQLALLSVLAALWLRRRELCLELIIAGRTSVPLACIGRVRRRLLDPHTLEELAKSLDEMVELAAALRRPQPGAPRPLCDVRVIRAVAPELSEIASLLRDARPSVRGVALVAWLLTSSMTPLYGPSIEPLRQELGRARYLLTVQA